MTLMLNDYLLAFPFQDLRPNQRQVLQEICDAFNQGYKVIVLEAPTGFGKSPLAMCVARTLGSSYICSATKELQTQYVNDFPHIRSVKGMNNFGCLVREDFALNDSHRCEECGIGTRCRHQSVSYGPCHDSTEYSHIKNGCSKCRDIFNGAKFHTGCRYRTYGEDYYISDRNTVNETVSISDSRFDSYQNWYKSTGNTNIWSQLNKLDKNEIRDKFQPCPYYDQLNKGLLASHTIFNYANFLIFMRMKNNDKILPQRELLVLDEGHLIENQIVEQIGFSITRMTLQKYTSTNLLDDETLNYTCSMERWLKFLMDLCELLRNSIPTIRSDKKKFDAKEYLLRLELMQEAITIEPYNWIMSNIEQDYRRGINKIIKIEFKPLDVSPYCKGLLKRCSRTLIMSATILDIDAFCRNVGLNRNDVKFIQVGSDFPLENRPIYQLDIAHLNYNSLRQESVQKTVASAVDRIMSIHKNDKGIIHTTSYEQVRFIQKYISAGNRMRLIYTDPEKPREQVTAEHFISTMPTVLISPSLHTGLDLKEERSRFQVLVKIPYPNKGDRWITSKMRIDPGWYNWQTKLRLVQACGRSVRSKHDWAKTYVIDSYFGDFVNRNVLPDWFTRAIKVRKIN